MYEYSLLVYANCLKQIDLNYYIHSNAWLGVAAKATNKSGKPVYTRFEKFFNYKKQIEELTKKPAKTSPSIRKAIQYFEKGGTTDGK